MSKSIIIRGTVEILDEEKLLFANFLELRQGMRPSLFFNELYYGSILYKTEGLLVPGACAAASFLMFSDALLDAGVNIGDKIEIRGGTKPIGIILVEEIKRVFVQRDCKSDDGYKVIEIASP